MASKLCFLTRLPPGAFILFNASPTSITVIRPLFFSIHYSVMILVGLSGLGGGEFCLVACRLINVVKCALLFLLFDIGQNNNENVCSDNGSNIYTSVGGKCRCFTRVFYFSIYLKSAILVTSSY